MLGLADCPSPPEEGTTMLTAEGLYARADRERYELVRGSLRVCEPPGGLHGALAVRVAGRLAAHVDARGLGVVLAESGYILSRDPDTVRGPDVSFLSRARLGDGPVPAAFIPGPPDLAVEILSPADRAADVAEKVVDYLDGGTRLVWVVDPERGRVVIHRPGTDPQVVAEDAALDGEDVVPGFRMTIAELMARG
jgi:Uma2 family endonuclease